MELLHEMAGKNICSDVVTYSGLIDGFSKVGKLEKAMDLLHEISGKNICPNVVTYNACLLTVSAIKAS